MMTVVPDRTENIVGKGENAGYQHFLLFPQCFKRLLVQSRLQSELSGKGLTFIWWLNSADNFSGMHSLTIELSFCNKGLQIENLYH